MKNFARRLKNCVAEFILIPIRFYQVFLSPDHGIGRSVYGSYRCRFFPSCSAYAAASVRQYGFLSGSVVSLKRLVRCHPFSRGGYDPVPSPKTDFS